MVADRWASRIASILLVLLIAPLPASPGTSAEPESAMVDSQTATMIRIDNDNASHVLSPLESGDSIEDFYAFDPQTASSESGFGESEKSLVFLYQGPNGLSLVILHDAPDTSGGTVRMDFAGLPIADGSWVVQDDGPGVANEDFSSDSDTSVTWRWSGCCTDGGAFHGGLDEEFEITIDPVWDEDVPGWELISDPAPIDEWVFLSGDLAAPTRTPLTSRRRSRSLPMTRSCPCGSGMT